MILALQLNNWNEDRKAQAEFDLYIVQLKEDVRLAISVAESRSEGAERRMQYAQTVLRGIKDFIIEHEDMEEFETALNGLDVYSFSGIHFGLLGQLLNGNLEAVTRDRELSRKVLAMTAKLEPPLRVLKEMAENSNFVRATITKHRGKSNSLAPEIKLSYNIESLRASDEFAYTTQNWSTYLVTISNQYNNIKESLENFLAVLEKYE